MMFVDTEDALHRHLTPKQVKFVRGLGQTFEKLSYQALRQKRFNLAMMMATKAQLCNEALSQKNR